MYYYSVRVTRLDEQGEAGDARFVIGLRMSSLKRNRYRKSIRASLPLPIFYRGLTNKFEWSILLLEVNR